MRGRLRAAGCRRPQPSLRQQKRKTTRMQSVHEGERKRHAVQPSVCCCCCCLPAKGTSPKYSSTLSVDMLLSERETEDREPLDASSEPPAGNCSRSSSVSVSMSRERRLYTCRQQCVRSRSVFFSLSSLFFYCFVSNFLLSFCVP